MDCSLFPFDGVAAMKNIILFVLIAALCLGAVTLDYGRGYEMRRVTVTLSSNGSGADSETIAAAYSTTYGANTPIMGKLLRVVTNPGDDSSSPTAAWDLALTDADGVDLTSSSLGNRSQSASEQWIAHYPVAFIGPLTLSATNMGSTKTATVSLYFGQ